MGELIRLELLRDHLDLTGAGPRPRLRVPHRPNHASFGVHDPLDHLTLYLSMGPPLRLAITQ